GATSTSAPSSFSPSTPTLSNLSAIRTLPSRYSAGNPASPVAPVVGRAPSTPCRSWYLSFCAAVLGARRDGLARDALPRPTPLTQPTRPVTDRLRPRPRLQRTHRRGRRPPDPRPDPQPQREHRQQHRRDEHALRLVPLRAQAPLQTPRVRRVHHPRPAARPPRLLRPAGAAPAPGIALRHGLRRRLLRQQPHRTQPQELPVVRRREQRPAHAARGVRALRRAPARVAD